MKEETPPSQTRRFFLRGATHEILGEASFCFASTPQLEESPEAKSVLSLLRSGECQFKCKGPQKAQGKRKGRACIPRSSPSILGDSDRYLLVRLISITQATNKRKTHYRNLNINHVPHQGREDYQNMYSKQRLSSQHRSLCPRVAACVVQYMTLKAERCRNYVPKQELYQNKRYMPNTEIP